MIYCCEKCQIEFQKKSNYDRHINRKTPCILEEKEQYDIGKRTCLHCEVLYSSVQALKIHTSTCKFKPTDEEDDLKQIIIQLNNDKIEEIVTELKNKINEQNSELTNLKNKLSAYNNEINNLKTKLSNNNGKLNVQTSKLNNIKTKLSHNDGKMNKHIEELQDVKDKLSNSDEKITKQNNELKDELDNLKNKISTTNKKKENAIEKYKKKAIPKALKNKVWDKYIGIDIGQTKCLCCKITNISQLNFHCGHIISEKCGGELTMENLKPICGSCNGSMGTMNMDEFIHKYKF
jgi:DNA repair exonuclease SbcCD ATPase subunit